MSGIYGIVRNSTTKKHNDCLSKMSIWNMAYGDSSDTPSQSHQEITLDQCELGIYRDHITNAPFGVTALVHNKTYHAAIDAIIYNRTELLEKLSPGSVLSDEELILELIIQFGFDVLSEINGDFAGAVYNCATGTLTLFRDHLGVRPLFVYHDDNQTAFSTDIRGIIACPGVDTSLREEWLYRMINGYDTSDYVKTEFLYINQATPASYITIDKQNTVSIKPYWKLGAKKIKLKDKQAYYDALRNIITDSVRRRLAVFPDKIGAELSGGLDSGVIDILIHRLGREACYYSWSFSPEDLPLVPDDERQVIADICEQEGVTCLYGDETMNMGPASNIGKSHTRLGLSVDMAREPEFNYALPTYLNTLIICETAELMKNNGCKVIFSGHGGDEGVSHRGAPFEMFNYGEYVHFFLHFLGLYKGEKRHLIRTVKRFIKSAQNGIRYTKEPFRTNFQAPELLNKTLADSFKSLNIPPLYFAYDPIKYVYSGNTHVRPDVAGLLGAYSGARYIFPYLDHDVIDFAVSIPRYLYFDGERKRVIFREAFKDIMPKSLYEVTAKDNPSTANQEYKPDPEWAPKFRKYKDWLLGELNRDFWNKYLDYDVIDNWTIPDAVSEEDKEIHRNRASLLKTCLQLQNMIQKVREI